MEIPEPVRALAVHPFRELPTPNDVEVFELDGVRVSINPWPSAQLVFPVGDGPADPRAAVERSREIAREHGKSVLAWWIAREHDHLVPQLEACGLVNEDTPGFEETENALALTERPAGEPASGVETFVVEEWEDWLQASRVLQEVFGMPVMTDSDLRARYENYTAGAHEGRSVCARVDGKIVASSYAAYSHIGVNLFGAAVLPESRGRGVYRTLVHARWAMAVERGTPALTVQAGRMSRPILERVGFQFVEPVRVFVDNQVRP